MSGDGAAPLLGGSRAKTSSFQEAAGLFAINVNYIFGAGVLGLPYAVAHGGVLSSSVLLVFCSAVCLVSMLWVLEAHHRAVSVKGGGAQVVEFAEMCRLFLGVRAQQLYNVSLTIYAICSCWMYASIFSLSMAKSLPVWSNASQCDISSHTGPLWQLEPRACWGDYLLYEAVFAVVMSFVVRMDIGAMKGMQMSLTAFGLTAMLTMCVTVWVAIPGDHLAHLDSDTAWFNPSGFGGVFGTFVFAQMCHQGVPLLQSVPSRKSLVKPVFVGTLCFTTVLYLVFGVSCALFFGLEPRDNPEPLKKLITLNWVEYTAGADKAGVLATIVSYFVRLYPAITVSAAFPLYVITLANGWFQAWHGSGSGSAAVGDAGADAHVEAAAAPPQDKTLFNLLAMCPPVLFAAFMADLSFMLFFVGLTGILIAFLLPPMLQLASIKAVPSMAVTVDSGHFSRPVYCYFCLGWAVVTLVITLVNQFK